MMKSSKNQSLKQVAATVGGLTRLVFQTAYATGALIKTHEELKERVRVVELAIADAQQRELARTNQARLSQSARARKRKAKRSKAKRTARPAAG